MIGPLDRRAIVSSLAALPALSAPVLAATDPHVAYRQRLHTAFMERRLARPVANEAVHGSLEDDAAALAIRASQAIVDEVMDLPAPSTLDGLGMVGLALAIQCEGMASLEDGAAFPDDDQLVAIARAILAVTREPLPEAWGGWGDEPGYFDREVDYLESGIGTLPAWALAQAKEDRAKERLKATHLSVPPMGAVPIEGASCAAGS